MGARGFPFNYASKHWTWLCSVLLYKQASCNASRKVSVTSFAMHAFSVWSSPTSHLHWYPCSPSHLNLQAIAHVIPCVRELSLDSSQYVRAALAGVVMELAPLLGKQATIDHLVPVFLTLLKVR